MRRGAGGCHPARGVEPTLSSSPRVAPLGVASGGTGCAHPAPGLSSRFEALVSVLLSPACGLLPPVLGDVGLRAAQLVSAGFIFICPLSGYTAIRHQIVWYVRLGFLTLSLRQNSEKAKSSLYPVMLNSFSHVRSSW